LKRALLFALLLGACQPSVAQPPIVDQWRVIELRQSPAEITWTRDAIDNPDGAVLELGPPRIGDLIFAGGLVLSSDDAGFGGLSGVEVLDDGRLIAVTDSGSWLTAHIENDADGRLARLSEPRLAMMRDENGDPFETKRAGDSEGVTQLPDGRFAVSFEQSQSIRIYDLNRDGPFGSAAHGPALADTQNLPPNRGLEAIAADEDGALIIGEEGAGGSVRLWRAPLNATAPSPVLARYRPARGYALVGLDRLPGGEFVALERFYAPVIGGRARLVRFDLPDAGESVTTIELGHLGPPRRVENFEGVSAVRNGDGSTRIYIVSDDGFSPRYRTILYAFDVRD
jgi:hypothetical protein